MCACYGPWTPNEHLSTLGVLVETAAQRAVLLVSGSWPDTALRSAESEPGYARIQVAGGRHLFLAQLEPAAESAVSNDTVVRRLISDALA
jgi:hypothetical protein